MPALPMASRATRSTLAASDGVVGDRPVPHMASRATRNTDMKLVVGRLPTLYLEYKASSVPLCCSVWRRAHGGRQGGCTSAVAGQGELVLAGGAGGGGHPAARGGRCGCQGGVQRVSYSQECGIRSQRGLVGGVSSSIDEETEEENCVVDKEMAVVASMVRQQAPTQPAHQKSSESTGNS